MKTIKKSTIALFSLLLLIHHAAYSVVVQGSTSASGGKNISAAAFQFTEETFWTGYATGGASQPAQNSG